MMGKNIFLLVTIFTSVLFSCQEHYQRQIKIEIRIDQPISGYLSLSDYDEIISIDTFDNGGLVQIEFLPIHNSSTYSLDYNNQSVMFMANAGDILSIEFDSNFLAESFKINGEKYDYVSYKEQKSAIAKEFWKDVREIYTLPAIAYKSKIDSVSNAYEQLLYSYSYGNDKLWVETEMNNIKYNRLESYMVYPIEYRFFTNESTTSHDFLNYQELLDFNDLSLIGSNSYKSVMLNYLRIKSSKEIALERKLEGREDFTLLLIKQLELIDFLFEEKQLNDYFKYVSLASHIKRFGFEGIMNLVDEYLSQPISKSYVESLNKIIANYDMLGYGKMAPNAILETTSGKAMDLRKFEGKPLYIEVWATWCKPCLKESKSFIELSNTFNNILFISISIDEKRESWIDKVNALKENVDNVIYLRAVDGLQSDFAREYKIRAIPRAILIDSVGKFIEQNALLPSSKKTINLLNKISNQ